MKPINDPQLQLPLFSPEGYRVQMSNGDYVLLVPGGDYQGLIFSEIDFTSMTIKANFTGTTFRHCRFWNLLISMIVIFHNQPSCGHNHPTLRFQTPW